MQELQPHKKYLSIGEVAAHFGVSVEVLRKWEKDFPKVIRPYRTQKDTRLYDSKALKQVALVYRLLKERGMTVAGAQRWLSTQHGRETMTQEVIGHLMSVREQLLGMVSELDKLTPTSGAATTADTQISENA